jgi:two-component system sensor histidine kinase KdpD
MSEPENRPDPEVLLRRLHEEEDRAKRGKLKVFFGFAPGVGKTYRMLQVARDMVEFQKVDVVVAIVETHKRHETADMVLGLEILPRRKILYRGHTLEELDLDAALARKPEVLLVDELAHTNAPGSRHPKRWQDVEELLEAGINVFTTMNVQHIESLNDVIAQITLVQVRETVPDSVIDRADTIELVDIAPEELLERLKEGKVYLADQAKRATEHFFRRGNLLALRELALRRTAQHVDDDVQKYRELHGVSDTWPASERILVCVGPAPSSRRLVRAAARMAAGLRCPWLAAYVESSELTTLTQADKERLELHLRDAESLGGTVTRLSGPSIPEALISYAKKHNVTRIIIGKPTHPRLRDRLRGSLIDEVVRGSADVEVHVIGGEDLPDKPQPAAAVGGTKKQAASGYLAATLLVALTVGVASTLRIVFNVPDPEMLFLGTVMVTAVWLGRGPALLAAALGVACYDFFFVPPFFRFSVSDRMYFLTFAMMFGVGYVMSELAGRLKRQQLDAVMREERTAVLYALTKELAASDVPAQIGQVAAQHAAQVFAGNVVVLEADADGELKPGGASPEGTKLEAKDLGVAKWAFDRGELAGLGTDTLPGSNCLCASLRAGVSRLGVLAIFPKEKRMLHAEQRAFLDVFCRQVAAALERARLAEEARVAALRAKTEEMRSSLLSAVSHDLRTPLASITGAATSLRYDSELAMNTRRELVESICDQAERLERLVGNLLDMTRLESGALSLKRDWLPLEETVGSALTRLDARLGARKVTVEIADGLPLIFVAPVLFEQIFINLLENADKYTPAGSSIKIRAAQEQNSVVVEVIDEGPGLPQGSEERVFEKFYRGPHIGVSGAGLGLPICRGIAEAHGMSICAENSKAGGATFRITIPLAGTPPTIAPDEGVAE